MLESCCTALDGLRLRVGSHLRLLKPDCRLLGVAFGSAFVTCRKLLIEPDVAAVDVLLGLPESAGSGNGGATELRLCAVVPDEAVPYCRCCTGGCLDAMATSF